MRILLRVISLMLIGITVLSGVILSTSYWLDLPSILFLLGVGSGLWVMSCPFTAILRAFAGLGSRPRSQDEAAANAYTWSVAIRSLMYAGVLLTLIGTNQMQHSISDPQALGPASAVCIMAILYAFLLTLFLPVPAFLAETSRITPDQPVAARPSSSPVVFAFGLLLVLMLIVAVLFFGGSIQSLVHLPSALIIGGGTVGALLFFYSQSPVEHNTERVTWVIFILQSIGSIIGYIMVLQNLPHPGSVNSAIIAMHQTSIYALLITALFCFPLEDRSIRSRVNACSVPAIAIVLQALLNWAISFALTWRSLSG